MIHLSLLLNTCATLYNRMYLNGYLCIPDLQESTEHMMQLVLG